MRPDRVSTALAKWIGEVCLNDTDDVQVRVGGNICNPYGRTFGVTTRSVTPDNTMANCHAYGKIEWI